MIIVVDAILTPIRSAAASATVTRLMRGVIVASMLPVLLFGSLISGGVLIHDHQEYDTHLHRLAYSSPGSDKLIPEQGKGHHEHEEFPFEPRQEDSSQVLILQDLPQFALKITDASFLIQPVVSKITLPPPPIVTTTGNPFAFRQSESTIGKVRAHSTTAAILLTNHALLI